MSGPRSNGLGYPGQEVVESIGDTVEDIALNTARFSGWVVIGGLVLFVTPYVLPGLVKGTVRMIKHVPSLAGETLRLPFRLGGWLKTVRKDANPE